MNRIITLFFTIITSFSAHSQINLQSGDRCFDSGDYACAVTNYNAAFKNTTGKDKQIAEIKLGRAKRCTEHIKTANQAFTSKNYTSAKEEYQKILDSNSKDSYATSQIEKCNKAIEASIILSVSNNHETISNDNITLSPFGGIKRIIVYTNAESYSVSQLPIWCTVEIHSDYFYISFAVNTSKTDRKGGFKVNAGKKEVIVSLTQALQTSIETTLSVLNKKIDIKANERTVSINVNTNSRDYEITKLPKWCRVKTKYATRFSLECDENSSASSRSGKFTIAVGDKKVKIRLKQFGTER